MYEKHELNTVPKLSEHDYSALKDSIKRHGYLSEFGTIVLYEDKILDGWHRYKVCEELGIEPEISDFTGGYEEAIYFVIAAISRRHLPDFAKYEALSGLREKLKKQGNEKQKETLGGYKHNESVLSNTDKTDTHNTQKKLSEELGWSTGKTAQADYIDKHADEKAKEKLRSGEKSINKVYEEIRHSSATGKQVKERVKNITAEIEEEIRLNKIKKLEERPAYIRAVDLVSVCSGIEEAIELCLEAFPLENRLSDITTAIKYLRTLSVKIQRRNSNG